MKTLGKSIRVPGLSSNPGDYLSAPFWDCPHQHAPFKERRATIQAYDDWKSTTERTLSVPCGLTCPFIMSHTSSGLTDRFTFLFTTLVATRLCLRSDYM